MVVMLTLTSPGPKTSSAQSGSMVMGIDVNEVGIVSVAGSMFLPKEVGLIIGAGLVAAAF